MAFLSLGKPAPLRINVLFIGCGGGGKTTLWKSLAQLYGGSGVIFTDLDYHPKVATVHEVCDFYHASPRGDCAFHFYDCLGFGDFINNEDAVVHMRQRLISAHEKWAEVNVNRLKEKERNLVDERMHLAILAFPPFAFRDLHSICLSELSALVPIVPVVTKADSMTFHERKTYLEVVGTVINDLANHYGRQLIFEFDESQESVPSPIAAIKPQGRRPNESQRENSLVCSPTDVGSDGSFEHYSTSPSDVLEGTSALILSFTQKDTLRSSSPGSSPTVHIPEQSIAPLTVVGDIPQARNIFAVVCDQTNRRAYPWGEIDTLDEHLSDFRRLQRLIFESGKLVELRNLCQQMSLEVLSRREADRQLEQANEECLRATQECRTSQQAHAISVSLTILCIWAMVALYSVVHIGELHTLAV